MIVDSSPAVMSSVGFFCYMIAPETDPTDVFTLAVLPEPEYKLNYKSFGKAGQ